MAPARAKARCFSISFLLSLVCRATASLSLGLFGGSVASSKFCSSRRHSPAAASEAAVRAASYAEEQRRFAQHQLSPNYVLNPGERLCSNHRVDLAVSVHSSVSNLDGRASIRDTYGDVSHYGSVRVVVFFVLGSTPFPSVQQRVLDESRLYDDIVQESFLDTHRNQSYKAMASMRWVSHFCRQAEFVLKIEDDTFVNLFKLIAKLSTVRQSALLCNAVSNRAVKRDVKVYGRWTIQCEEYAPDVYPDVCERSYFIMPLSTMLALYSVASIMPVFWVADIWLTALVRHDAQVRFAEGNQWKQGLHTEWKQSYQSLANVSDEATFSTSTGYDTWRAVWSDVALSHSRVFIL